MRDASRLRDGGDWTLEAYGDVGILHVFHPQCQLTETALREGVEAASRQHPLRAVYRKDLYRDRSQGQSPPDLTHPQPWWGEPVDRAVQGKEGDIGFWIWPYDGYHVGWFLDQRDNRKAVRARHRKGGSLLNLFCYTGAFSLGPARDGAVTTNVDLSKRTLGKLRENLELNQLDPSVHRFVAEDAGKYLARCARRGEKFDTIVFDPPTFARVGRQVFQVTRDLAPLVTRGFELLNPGGQLWVSTNTHQWTQIQFEQAMGVPSGWRALPVPPAPGDCVRTFEVKSLWVQKPDLASPAAD